MYVCCAAGKIAPAEHLTPQYLHSLEDHTLQAACVWMERSLNGEQLPIAREEEDFPPPISAHQRQGSRTFGKGLHMPFEGLREDVLLRDQTSAFCAGSGSMYAGACRKQKVVSSGSVCTLPNDALSAPWR